jgi:hypothetical protein
MTDELTNEPTSEEHSKRPADGRDSYIVLVTDSNDGLGVGVDEYEFASIESLRQFLSAADLDVVSDGGDE